MSQYLFKNVFGNARALRCIQTWEKRDRKHGQCQTCTNSLNNIAHKPTHFGMGMGMGMGVDMVVWVLYLSEKCTKKSLARTAGHPLLEILLATIGARTDMVVQGMCS